MGKAPLSVAKLHAVEEELDIDYQQLPAEQLAAEKPGSFDVVTCMEMLEHVPSPESVIEACSKLVKPGGSVFFSTINRNPKSFLFAIVGAEYVLNMLPKGTHEYGKFIRPSELETQARQSKLIIQDIKGMTYNPVFQTYKLGNNVDVNYLMYFTKTEGEGEA
jgi:2-polyprenyl-6-hydroxyphenyl methylase/3-demethylubiquinone-9 3-methyltransferase